MPELSDSTTQETTQPPFSLVHDVSGKTLSTMQTLVNASLLCRVFDAESIPDALKSLPNAPIPIGAGSNMLLTDHIKQPFIRIEDKSVCVRSTGEHHVYVSVAAGLAWDALIDLCLSEGWHGLENLALIPGHVGAAPIQNIGAYGVEVAQCITHVRVFDQHEHIWLLLDKDACQFGYRDSLFKHQPDRYIISHVHFKLHQHYQPLATYPGVVDTLASLGFDTKQPSAANMVQAIRTLRASKLPNPATTPNLGSFFKNPIVREQLCDQLRAQESELVYFPAGDRRKKLSAAWLIDRAGLKGHCVGNACVSTQHALILINQGDASGDEFKQLIQRVQTEVSQRFGIELEPEPRLLPND